MMKDKSTGLLIVVFLKIAIFISSPVGASAQSYDLTQRNFNRLNFYSFNQEETFKKKILFRGAGKAPDLIQRDSNRINLYYFEQQDTIRKKRFFRAAGEVLLVQVIPWAYNYFIRDADFAHITWESIGHNLKLSSWEWDENAFTTNQFAHPFHGNLYFNAFRTNGYSFWGSVPGTAAGSYIWETFGETHPPSINDFINTTLGGISLGEITYRISQRAINEQRTGFKRQASEVLVFFLNPINGFNRLLDGDWGRYKSPPAVVDSSKIIFVGDMDAGLRRISVETKDLFTKGDNEFYFRLTLQHGDPYTDTGKPFEHFFMRAEISDLSFNTVRVSGLLHGFRLKERPKSKRISNISLDYNYFSNPAFQYGSQNVSFNHLIKSQIGRGSTLSTVLGGSAIVLAAVPDKYLNVGEGRTYDYGPGVNVFGGGFLNINNKITLNINLRAAWFITLNGNDSSYLLKGFTSEARYLFSKRFSTGFEFGRLTLDGYYRDFEDVKDRYPYFRLSGGYNFSF